MIWLIEPDSGIKWEPMQIWVDAAETNGEPIQSNTVWVNKFQPF